MRNLILLFTLLVSGFMSAQTFDFSCEAGPDWSGPTLNVEDQYEWTFGDYKLKLDKNQTETWVTSDGTVIGSIVLVADHDSDDAGTAVYHALNDASYSAASVDFDGELPAVLIGTATGN